MTISRKALRSGLYLGLATTFLALIGMFTALAQRYIIADTWVMRFYLGYLRAQACSRPVNSQPTAPLCS